MELTAVLGEIGLDCPSRTAAALSFGQMSTCEDFGSSARSRFQSNVPAREHLTRIWG